MIIVLLFWVEWRLSSESVFCEGVLLCWDDLRRSCPVWNIPNKIHPTTKTFSLTQPTNPTNYNYPYQNILILLLNGNTLEARGAQIGQGCWPGNQWVANHHLYHNKPVVSRTCDFVIQFHLIILSVYTTKVCKNKQWLHCRKWQFLMVCMVHKWLSCFKKSVMANYLFSSSFISTVGN